MELVPNPIPILHLLILAFGHAAALGGRKIVNKIGDLLTIAHEIWELSWDPEAKGNRSGNDLVIFGRNRRTGYSGLIRVQAIAELEPEELERWRRSNLFPPGPDYSQLRVSSPISPSPMMSPSKVSLSQRTHSSREACNCQENIDPVAQYKRNNPNLGWQSNPTYNLKVLYFTDDTSGIGWAGNS